MTKVQNSKENNEDSEYIGNIWGWKFSWWALVIIALLTVWVFIRSQNAKQLGTSEKQTIEHVR